MTVTDPTDQLVAVVTQPDTQLYAVNTIYQSIQGEGAMTGTPMVILRLQGCGVGCPWCDTKQTWFLDDAHRQDLLHHAIVNPLHWAYASAEGIMTFITTTFPPPTSVEAWVLLTGGEPANQLLAPLVQQLHLAGFRVALETSGTARGHLGAGCDFVTVSPKIDMPGGLPIDPEVVRSADEIKWVVGRERDIDRLLGFINTHRLLHGGHPIISVQPLSQSDAATRLCIDACQRYGWRLSVQLHKYLHLP